MSVCEIVTSDNNPVRVVPAAQLPDPSLIPAPESRHLSHFQADLFPEPYIH
jgi:hypothetical protein